MISGKALVIAAVCSAASPPARSSVAATAPSDTAQKIRCQTGGFSAPPELIISITNEPESDEVTKKVTISIVARAEVTVVNGSCSSMTNIATGILVSTADARPTPISCISSHRPLLPKVVNHKKVKPEGTKSTPRINSRMVRPRDMRAMNMPTNGDQETHQAQ